MQSTDFYVTVLGSGAAIPTLSRHCSSQLVNVHGFRILLDCGEGTQNQLRAYHQRLQSVSVVCITHLHGDHFFGLPGLLSTMHMCGRDHEIVVIGPEGIREAVETINRFSGQHFDFPISFVELSSSLCATAPQQVYQCRRCTISAFALRHSVSTFGFLIEEVPHGSRPPRRYAYCTDTGFFDSLADVVHGVNLLCMESTFANDYEQVAIEKQHCTAAQAATLASMAGVRQLLLTHFSARYKDIAPLMEQATAIFPNTLPATDGHRYGVEHWTDKRASKDIIPPATDDGMA
ncbi:MAG: ribonuclease Z [Bacteroidales bacterium]|nr:ribonuclease Z [Bacteroidales bacterium]